jgi:hypothetical protein
MELETQEIRRAAQQADRLRNEKKTGECAAMRKRVFSLACGMMLMLGVSGHAAAQNDQDNAGQPLSARQELQHIHTPHSIDQEMARLTKDLELTSAQQKQVLPLLEEHHDKIQALLYKNPSTSRQALGPQIHAISDVTHHEIHALLNEHQQELEQAMQQREHNGEEGRRPERAGTSPAAPGGI